MSRIINPVDTWARLNALEIRLAILERFSQGSPPAESDNQDDVFDVSSESYTVPSGSPTVTVQVGASGMVLVQASAVIGIDGAVSSHNWQGVLSAVVDGDTATEHRVGEASASPISGTVPSLQFTVSDFVMLKDLSLGTHEIALGFLSTNGDTIHFSRTAIVVTPY